MATKKKFSREQLNAAMKTAMKRYSHRSNITGFDVGYRWTKNEPTKEMVVRIHVKEKIPLSELEKTEIFPADIDGVPLDIIQGPYKIKRLTVPADHQARVNLLMGGVSCGRPDGGTGTIGAIVIDNKTGNPALLSNWHVLTGPRGRVGDPIVQPGPADKLPEPADVVAQLARHILGLDGDAAIATLSGARSWLPISYGSYNAPQEIRDSRLGEVLAKSGRTTAQTRARVDGEGIYRISYEVSPGVYQPRDITGFKLVPETPGNPDNDELSSGGDSGSLWINPNTNEAVGLHFAGETNPNPAAEHAIACNMTSVSAKLDFRMATFDDLLAVSVSGQPAGASNPPPIDSQNSAELTLGPDDGPVWPGWPTGPLGGHWPPHQYWWPWGPIGPRNPFDPSGPRPVDPRYLMGGEVPWPLNTGGIDQNWGRSTPITAMETGFETVANKAAGKEIQASQIWTMLRAALVNYNEAFSNIVSQDEKLSRLIKELDPRFVLAGAVNSNPGFGAQGINSSANTFLGDITYRNAVGSLAKIYFSNGWDVKNG